jgi:2-iminobutanoate/2-iminopropanoate deaminase
MATIEPYAAKSVYDPPGYAQAVKVTGAQTILFLSGQVAYSADGGVAHAGDFAGQARACLEAVKAQVEAGGGSMANIVKVNTYLTDLRYRPEFAAIREAYFGKRLPASTMVGVSGLAHPDYLIEIEAVAVL